MLALEASILWRSPSVTYDLMTQLCSLCLPKKPFDLRKANGDLRLTTYHPLQRYRCPCLNYVVAVGWDARRMLIYSNAPLGKF